jgi:hypothetical protein
MLLPNRTNDRTDKLLPPQAKLLMEALLPRRANERTDSPAPKWPSLATDSWYMLPVIVHPITLTVEPRRMKERRLKHDPR